MTTFFDPQRLLPGAQNELPGFDPYWKTQPNGAYQNVDGAGAALNDYYVPVGPGETLYFEVPIFLLGAQHSGCQLTVHTPPNPNGGFHIQGMDSGDSWAPTNYGADDFNFPAGDLSTGKTSSLQSYAMHFVWGTLHNGHIGGDLWFEITGAADGVQVAPGGHIRIYRIGDGRKNEATT